MSRRLAARGAMALQYCDGCGSVLYPPRELCPACLSGNISWRPSDGRGKVLAVSLLAHSFDPALRAHLPRLIVSVQLNEGPVVIAYAVDGNLGPGAKVYLVVDQAASGGPALLAQVTERQGQV